MHAAANRQDNLVFEPAPAVMSGDDKSRLPLSLVFVANCLQPLHDDIPKDPSEGEATMPPATVRGAAIRYLVVGRGVPGFFETRRRDDSKNGRLTKTRR